MELDAVIRSRRTIFAFKSDPVPDEILREMIDLAVWAPNHHLTEPWRFRVLQGDSLKQLARFRYQAVLQKNAGKPQAERVAQKAEADFLEVPAIIVAIQKLDPDPARQAEDYAAVSCAVYNLLLAAWNRGVGTYWGTGPLTRFAPARQWLELADDEQIVGVIKVGYPAKIDTMKRTPGSELTRWLS